MHDASNDFLGKGRRTKISGNVPHNVQSRHGSCSYKGKANVNDYTSHKSPIISSLLSIAIRSSRQLAHLRSVQLASKWILCVNQNIEISVLSCLSMLYLSFNVLLVFQCFTGFSMFYLLFNMYICQPFSNVGMLLAVGRQNAVEQNLCAVARQPQIHHREST